MDNVKRFGFVPDRVYDHDKFGLVGPLTEGTIYVEAVNFDASQASVVALKAENEALLKGLTGKNALTGATYAHLIEERDALRRHLHEAATSLETISKLAGRDEYMKHMSQVCGYANSRATVARAFMDQPGPVPSILDLSYEDAHKIDCELPAQHLPGGHTIGGQHFPAPAPVVERQEPFMYGIMQPDGKPHYSELCVSGEASDLESEVESMNEGEDLGFRVVPLFTSPTAPVAVVLPNVALTNEGNMPATLSDYESVLADHKRLVRELDVLLNGEAGAADQASLCDIVAQVRMTRKKPGTGSLQLMALVPDQVVGRVHRVEDVPDQAYVDLNSCGRALPEGAPLYARPADTVMRYVRAPSRKDPKYHEEWPEIEGGPVFDGVTYCNDLFEALKRYNVIVAETMPEGAVDE